MKLITTIVILGSMFVGCAPKNRKLVEQSSSLTSVSFKSDENFKDAILHLNSIEDDAIYSFGKFFKSQELQMGGTLNQVTLKVGAKINIDISATYEDRQVKGSWCSDYVDQYEVNRTKNEFNLALCFENGSKVTDSIISGESTVETPESSTPDVADAIVGIDTLDATPPTSLSSEACVGDDEVCITYCNDNSLFCKLDIEASTHTPRVDHVYSSAYIQNNEDYDVECQLRFEIFGRKIGSILTPIKVTKNYGKVFVERNSDIRFSESLRPENFGLEYGEGEYRGKIIGSCKKSI